MDCKPLLCSFSDFFFPPHPVLHAHPPHLPLRAGCCHSGLPLQGTRESTCRCMGALSHHRGNCFKWRLSKDRFTFKLCARMSGGYFKCGACEVKGGRLHTWPRPPPVTSCPDSCRCLWTVDQRVLQQGAETPLPGPQQHRCLHIHLERHHDHCEPSPLPLLRPRTH